MKSHASAQLEDVRGLVGLAPRFGQVAFEREGPGLDRRPGLVSEQTTMGEGVGNLCLERDDEIGIPVRRVPEAQRERAAALGRLGEGAAHGQRRRAGDRGQRSSRDEPLAAREGVRDPGGHRRVLGPGRLVAHGWPPVRPITVRMVHRFFRRISSSETAMWSAVRRAGPDRGRPRGRARSGRGKQERSRRCVEPSRTSCSPAMPGSRSGRGLWRKQK